MLFVAPVGDEDHSARVGALVRDLMAAVPALQTQPAFSVVRAWQEVGLVGHAGILAVVACASVLAPRLGSQVLPLLRSQRQDTGRGMSDSVRVRRINLPGVSVEIPDGWVFDEDHLTPVCAFAPLFLTYRTHSEEDRSAPDEREPDALSRAVRTAYGLTRTAVGLDRPDADVPAGLMSFGGATWLLSDSACAWVEIEPQWASSKTFAAGCRKWLDATLSVTWNGSWIAEPETSAYRREARTVFESVQREA